MSSILWGCPYKGSKNLIVDFICKNLPKRRNFYDLFCGGGAVLHRAIYLNMFSNYYANDLNKLSIKGLEMAFNGDFKDEKRWISREEFFRLKDVDYYVACCFSFSNNFGSYAYAHYIEPWKEALHYARVFNDFSLFREFGFKLEDASRINIKKHFTEYEEKYTRWYYSRDEL